MRFIGLRTPAAIAAALVLAVTAACSPSASPTATPSVTSQASSTPSGPGPIGSVGDPELVRKSFAAFAFDLQRRLYAESLGENIVFSPLSIAAALTMTYNGAAGETRWAMAETLGLDGLERDTVNQAMAALLQQLQDRERTDINVANSLWAQDGFPFDADFLQRNRDFFDAAIEARDFSDPATVDEINRWVSDATNGKISKLLDNINPNEVMFLINAIYFNGPWLYPFDPKDTQERPFHLADGTETQHPTMHTRGGKLHHLDGDGFQAVRLPYHDGTSMYVFLPDEDSTLDAFLDGLDIARWNKWMGQFQEKGVDLLALPTFTTKYEATLNQVLSDMGMGIAFGGGADFSDMTPGGGLWISEVRHAATIEVFEEGTEAAAATSVGMATSAPASSFTMVVDRPCLYAIVDEATGSILFMGTVADPSL